MASVSNGALRFVKKYISTAIVTFAVFGFTFCVFAQEASETQNQTPKKPEESSVPGSLPEDSISNNKRQELKQFIAEHQEELKEAKKSEDEYDDSDSLQMFYRLLDDQEKPAKLQAYDFLVLSTSPEFWRGLQTAENTAQLYLKILKHSNPVVRLYGLSAVSEFKERVKNPKEGQSNEDTLMLRKIIEIIEVEYSPSTQDSDLLKQYNECFVYLKPFVNSRDIKNIDIDMTVVAFENADPAVQFYLAIKISLFCAYELDTSSDIYDKQRAEVLKLLLVRLKDKGDIYTKGLVVGVALMDMKQISQLLKNSVNSEEFITLGGFLSSRNMEIPFEAWPNKTGLEVMFNKLSISARRQILELIEKSFELG